MIFKFISETSNYAYVMSIAVMVNEKFREAVPAWDCFQDEPKQFGHFFEQVDYKYFYLLDILNYWHISLPI